MKKYLGLLAIVLAVTTGCMGSLQSVQLGYNHGTGSGQGYRADSGIDYMYDYLAPYGNWIEMEPYGFVWTPRYTGYRWRPYSDGHWVSTEDGWTWMANEEWGSIPFHYGRWGFDDDLGWFWVPGTEWSPAWVSWRWSDQYTGWAPLPPGVEFHAGMDFRSHSYHTPVNFWVFLQTSRFMDRNLHRYALPYERNQTIFNITIGHQTLHYRNNRVINDGIGIDAVRRITRRDIPRYRIREVEQHHRARLSGQDIEVFRPDFKRQVTAKPRVILRRDQARQDLQTARVFEPRRQTPIKQEQTAVHQRQVNEKTLLKKTQTQEMRALQLRYQADLSREKAKNKKAKIRQDLQSQKVKMQKQHQVEKNALVRRHKNDAAEVKKIVKRNKKK
jgi:hypothetical protein